MNQHDRRIDYKKEILLLSPITISRRISIAIQNTNFPLLLPTMGNFKL